MNTAINADTVIETITTAAVETPVVSEMEKVKQNPNATIQDFVELANKGLIDKGFVFVIQDIARDIAAVNTPENVDAELEKIHKELMAEKDNTKRLSIMLRQQELINKQMNSGSDVRNRLTGIDFSEIANAYAAEINQMIEMVLVKEFLAKAENYTLKEVKRRKNGVVKVKADAAPSEQITFEAKGKTFVIKAGKGRLSSELLEVATEHAKAVKDEEAQKKPNFIAALKEGKVKGAKVIKVEVA